MEFIINPSLLREELSLLAPVIERKATIPVLSKIKLETSLQGELALTATDLDVTMRSSNVAQVLQGGSVLVEGRKLHEISRELPNEPIHFVLNSKGQVEIRYKNGRHRLGITESSQFPEVATGGHSSISIPAVILREAIRRTAFAVTAEKSRFAISGTKLLIDETSLTMVGTDGHRLAYSRFPLVGRTGEKLDLLVPKKTLGQLAELLDRELRRDAEAAVEISDSAIQLGFAVGSRNLFSRALSGAFPNWEMVLPKDLSFAAEMGTEDFRQSLARVALTSETKNYSVTIEIAHDRLVFRSGAGDAEAQEEMPAAITGESFQDVQRLCFNSRYVQDFLQVAAKAESPTFLLAFKDAVSPFELFLPGSRENFRYVLMPLRASK